MSGDHRGPRRRHYAEDPAARGFGPGWTFYLPPQWDRAADYIVIRLYADIPGPSADGWEGLWFQPPGTQATETQRDSDPTTLIKWAKATQVKHILVEDAATRTFAELG